TRGRSTGSSASPHGPRRSSKHVSEVSFSTGSPGEPTSPSMARRSRRGASRLLPLMVLACLACSVTAHGVTVAAPILVVDNSFAVDTTDPQRAFDPTSTIVDRAVYDTLFTYRKNDLAHPIPLLVRSWTTSGARRFTFRLRRDVHFGDGTPLTSA